MGRKQKKKGSADLAGSSGQPTMSQHNKREVLELVNTLLEKSSCAPRTGAEEWQDFIDIHELVQKLRRKQQAHVKKPYHRDEHFGTFMSWLKENKVDTESIAIAHFDKEGHGLKVNQDVQMAEMFLSVPRRVMMSTETAKSSKLGFLLEVDKILQGMPNVVLALHLLTERASPDSFWTPYIKTLPSSYSTPLYFQPEEIQLLKGSPVYGEVLNQWRNISRQYAYFYTLFHTNPEAGKLPIKDFCFDDYRWAVSTVMTRQNQIPASDGDKVISALIPLWDMCNHTNGQITTDFNLEKDCSECYALRNFAKDSQVYIFYGSRSNGELFLHSGFVYPTNQCDRVSIKMGVSKNDPLYSLKAELLSRLTMLPSRSFHLYTGEDPVDSDLLAFLRIMNMEEGELQERLTGENATKLQRSLRDFGEYVSKQNEIKAWRFIETRATLLMRTYPTTVEDDGKELERFDLPEHSRLAIQLRRLEKRILKGVIAHAFRCVENTEAWSDDMLSTPFLQDRDQEDVDEAMNKIDLTGN